MLFRSEVVTQALRVRRADPTLVAPVLELVRGLETHHAVDVLDALMPHVPPGDPALVGDVLDAVLDLGDHDAGPLLRRIITDARPDDAGLRLREAALGAAGELEPYGRLEVLLRVSRVVRHEPRLETTYREIAATLDEAHDRRRALRAIGDRLDR